MQQKNTLISQLKLLPRGFGSKKQPMLPTLTKAKGCIGCFFMNTNINLILLLQKTSFQNDTTTINTAVYFVHIVGQSDTLYFRTTFNHHRRSFYL